MFSHGGTDPMIKNWKNLTWALICLTVLRRLNKILNSFTNKNVGFWFHELSPQPRLSLKVWITGNKAVRQSILPQKIHLFLPRIQNICCEVGHQHLGIISVFVFGQHSSQSFGIIHVFRDLDFAHFVTRKQINKIKIKKTVQSYIFFFFFTHAFFYFCQYNTTLLEIFQYGFYVY